MLNWTSLLANSFWVVGLSVILATLSYHSWRASLRAQRLSHQFQERSFLVTIWLGLALVGVGLAGTSAQWWEAAIWVLFTIIGIVNLLQTWGKTAGNSNTHGN